MQLRIALDRASALGLRDQIVSQVAQLVHDKVLQPETKLPSCRNFSRELGVSINTVVAAFTKLEEQNLIYVKPRSGFYVSDATLFPFVAELNPEPETKGSAISKRMNWRRQTKDLNIIRRPQNWHDYKYPFVCNQVAEDTFPVSEWRECSRQAMNRRDLKIWSSDGLYSETNELVEQICTRILPRRGVYSNVTRTMITLGSQNGIFIASQLLGGRNRIAVIEDPGYPDARKILQASFGQVRFQRVDEEGMVVDENLRDATLVYVTPNRQFPTTVTMSEQRRKDLVAAAEEYDFFIIEDDYECDLDYRHFTPFPLVSLCNQGRVIYLASMSKGLSPGLRLGYMSAAPEFTDTARDARGTMMRHPPTLLQLTAATFIRLGYYESHLRRTLESSEKRWKIADKHLREKLPGFEISGDFGGTNFLLSHRGRGITASEVVQAAEQEGIVVEEVSPCFSDFEVGKYFFRLGVSALPTKDIEPGIKALAKSLAHLTRYSAGNSNSQLG